MDQPLSFVPADKFFDQDWVIPFSYTGLGIKSHILGVVSNYKNNRAVWPFSLFIKTPPLTPVASMKACNNSKERKI